MVGLFKIKTRKKKFTNRWIVVAGVKVLNAACCEVQRSGPAAGQCLRDGAVCGNRQEYIFFDNFHPTEISNNVTAMRSYRALVPADASPVDIERLVRQ